MLRDVVTVVRAFRPHIIMARVLRERRATGTGSIRSPRFSRGRRTIQRPRHGSFSPTRRSARRGRRSSSIASPGFPRGRMTIRVNVGEFNAKLGKSYAEIAAESRSQHKSQGFGTLVPKGVVWDLLRREATRVNAATAPKDERSIFEGLEIVRLATLPVDERLAGPNIAVEAVSDRRVVALGDSARVVVTVYNRSAMQISARPGWPGAPRRLDGRDPPRQQLRLDDVPTGERRSHSHGGWRHRGSGISFLSQSAAFRRTSGRKCAG